MDSVEEALLEYSMQISPNTLLGYPKSNTARLGGGGHTTGKNRPQGEICDKSSKATHQWYGYWTVKTLRPCAVQVSVKAAMGVDYKQGY